MLPDAVDTMQKYVKIVLDSGGETECQKKMSESIEHGMHFSCHMSISCANKLTGKKGNKSIAIIIHNFNTS